MPRRSAGHRTMVRRARLQRRLQRRLRRHLRAALRTRSLAQPRTPTRLSGASRTRPAQEKGASRTPAAGTAMPQRLGGHRTMVRRVPLQRSLQRRLQRLLRRHLRAALRTRNLAQPRTPTRLSGASRTRPAQEKGASRTPAAGTAMPRRSAGHRIMVRRALLCRLTVPPWPLGRPRRAATG